MKDPSAIQGELVYIALFGKSAAGMFEASQSRSDREGWEQDVVEFISWAMRCGLIGPAGVSEHFSTLNADEFVAMLLNGDPVSGADKEAVWELIEFESTPMLDEILKGCGLYRWDGRRAAVDPIFWSRLARLEANGKPG